MTELKPNEKIIYDKLVEMAQVQNPVPLSLRKIDVKIKTKRWYSRWYSRKPSHMTVKEILKHLQAKGLITLDYSERQNPKVIVN